MRCGCDRFGHNGQAEILAAIPEERRGIFLPLALMGVRPGEVRALDCDDLQVRDDGLWVMVRHAMQGPNVGVKRGPTKTKRQRTLPAPAELAAWLEGRVDAQAKLESRPLFVNPNTGRRWSHWALRDTWMAARKKVGVDVSLYEGTKHTTATHLKTRGVDDRTLAALMGHSDTRSVEPYAQVETATKRAAIEQLRDTTDE
jgi:integrase